jgi:hypothetical protein
MINPKKIFCNLAIAIIPALAFVITADASIHDYETTRQKATAGAGAASILMEESATLNPACIAFFDMSSFYIQRSALKSVTNDSQTDSGDDSELLGLIISDAKGSVKGSMGVQKQKEDRDERLRLTGSLAMPMSQKSSIGVTWRYTTDTIRNSDLTLKRERYQQAVLGITQLFSSSLSMALVWVDPTKTREEDSRLILGGQYVLTDFFTIMGDVGTQATKLDTSNVPLWRTAVQLQLFDDFYFRAGIFHDKILGEKGQGVGVGWVSPRLSFEAGLKNVIPAGTPLQKNFLASKTRETSFSLSYRF